MLINCEERGKLTTNSHGSNNTKLLIKCSNTDNLHPHCPHGPTLLFYTVEHGEKNGYYACAAHRNKRDCNFYLSAVDLTAKSLNKRYEVSTELYREQRQKLFDAVKAEQSCHYCFNCNMPILESELSAHALHQVVQNLSVDYLKDPTQFLRPLDDDKVQAQYFFDTKALNFFAKCFRDMGISKVLCIGAPRLHAHLTSQCNDIESFLLDFDQRFFYFYDDEQYAWYNMCNNHFFDENQELNFRLFLKCSDAQRLLIFTDPPFGCRTEPIAQTLRQLVKLSNDINQSPHHPLAIFWVFPYFAEHYIQQEMSEMRMCDYKVNYTNHAAYTDSGSKCRKLGSPVRLFTNVPLERIQLPIEEQYKYCAICERYTALENRHCNKCGMCPSKNGATYRHCSLCDLCVKPTYAHCANCRRCTQVEGHNCEQYQARQSCWICLQRGHIEWNCVAWKRACRKKIVFQTINRPPSGSHLIICLLCSSLGHNERHCPQRSKFIEEKVFMGATELTFKV